MTIENLFIGIITFRRPKGLKSALEGIAAQTFTKDHPPVTVIVVDNDAAGPMAALIEEMRPNFPWTLHYAVHPESGIPFARNRVVKETGGAKGVLLFLDDDEVPEADWAEQLLEKYRETGAEAVLGPVMSEFEQAPPDWIRSAGFFGKSDFRDGDAVPYASTANILIDLKVFNEMGLFFEPSMRFTGGTDTLLGMQLLQKGGRMIWAEKARVREIVPPSRTTAKWLISRKFREGNTFVLSEKMAGSSSGRQAYLFASGLARVVGGAGLSVISLARGPAKRTQAFSKMARGLGMLNAFAGRRYHEYKKIHGS